MHVFLVHIAQDPHYLLNALLINIVDTISELYVKPNLIVLITNKMYALTKKRPCPIYNNNNTNLNVLIANCKKGPCPIYNNNNNNANLIVLIANKVYTLTKKGPCPIYNNINHMKIK